MESSIPFFIALLPQALAKSAESAAYACAQWIANRGHDKREFYRNNNRFESNTGFCGFNAMHYNVLTRVIADL